MCNNELNSTQENGVNTLTVHFHVHNPIRSQSTRSAPIPGILRPSPLTPSLSFRRNKRLTIRDVQSHPPHWTSSQCLDAGCWTIPSPLWTQVICPYCAVRLRTPTQTRPASHRDTEKIVGTSGARARARSHPQDTRQTLARTDWT